MIPKPFENIVHSDVAALIDNEVGERRTLEYKEQLPGNSESDKKEFLADISSFANAGGGDVLYGVKEKRDAAGRPTGIAEAAPGLDGINCDGAIQRLENMIRDGIEPRIPGIRIKAVEGFAEGPVIVVRVSRSWALPHMVRNSSRFYSRNSSGKYPLDVQEIRSAFAASDATPERIRRLRDERLSTIIADETPVRLDEGARIVLHVLPLAALDRTLRGDSTSKPLEWPDLRPIGANGLNLKNNFDGIVCTSSRSVSTVAYAYCQLFRSGLIESVRVVEFLKGGASKRHIELPRYEIMLVSALDTYLKTQTKLGLDPPWIILLSLLHVKGQILSSGRNPDVADASQEFDRDSLLLPDVLVEQGHPPASNLLRESFQMIWQAAGFPESQSHNYSKDGDWTRPQQ